MSKLNYRRGDYKFELSNLPLIFFFIFNFILLENLGDCNLGNRQRSINYPACSDYNVRCFFKTACFSVICNVITRLVKNQLSIHIYQPYKRKGCFIVDTPDLILTILKKIAARDHLARRIPLKLLWTS